MKLKSGLSVDSFLNPEGTFLRSRGYTIIEINLEVVLFFSDLLLENVVVRGSRRSKISYSTSIINRIGIMGVVGVNCEAQQLPQKRFLSSIKIKYRPSYDGVLKCAQQEMGLQEMVDKYTIVKIECALDVEGVVSAGPLKIED